MSRIFLGFIAALTAANEVCWAAFSMDPIPNVRSAHRLADTALPEGMLSSKISTFTFDVPQELSWRLTLLGQPEFPTVHIHAAEAALYLLSATHSFFGFLFPPWAVLIEPSMWGFDLQEGTQGKVL